VVVQLGRRRDRSSILRKFATQIAFILAADVLAPDTYERHEQIHQEIDRTALDPSQLSTAQRATLRERAVHFLRYLVVQWHSGGKEEIGPTGVSC
jgi:hypothetical protein